MESFWAPNILFERNDPHPAQLRFEAKRVDMVLKAFKLQEVAPQLVEDYHTRWNSRRLTFESFHRFFPTFPYMMEGQSFFKTSEGNGWMGLGTLFKSFDEHFIFKRYQILLHRYQTFSDPKKAILVEVVPPESRGLPLAMPFPCDGIRGGLVLHNNAAALSTGFKVEFDYYDEEMVHTRLWIEPFKEWLDALARLGWTPDSPPPPRRRPDRTMRRRGATVRPWMAELCGGVGADTYFLAWLLRMLRPTANKYEQGHRAYRKDGLWVAFIQARIAEGIGLSPDQLKRAIRTLHREGLIELDRGPAHGLNAVTYARTDRGMLRQRLKELKEELGN